MNNGEANLWIVFLLAAIAGKLGVFAAILAALPEILFWALVIGAIIGSLWLLTGAYHFVCGFSGGTEDTRAATLEPQSREDFGAPHPILRFARWLGRTRARLRS